MFDRSPQERVVTIGHELQEQLDLGWLTISHKFDERTTEDRVTAETKSDWEYRQATILWNVESVMLLDDDQLSATIIHEFVHVLIDPLWSALTAAQQDRFNKIHEFCTENVARAILAAATHVGKAR